MTLTYLDSNISYFPRSVKMTSYLDFLHPKTLKRGIIWQFVPLINQVSRLGHRPTYGGVGHFGRHLEYLSLPNSTSRLQICFAKYTIWGVNISQNLIGVFSCKVGLIYAILPPDHVCMCFVKVVGCEKRVECAQSKTSVLCSTSPLWL